MAAKAFAVFVNLQLLLLLTGLVAAGKDSYFNYLLRAGSYDCFLEELQEGSNVEIEYHVVSGGDLDINFYLAGPRSVGIVVSTHRERQGVHSFPVEVTGEYDICLDNSFSTFTDKTVYLSIFSYGGDEDDEFDELFDEEEALEELEEEVEARVEIMKNSTDGIRVSLRQIIAEQNRFRVREARHRYTADSNLILVTGFSFVNLLVMVTAAVTQVVVLRRLFKEYRKDRIKT